MENKLSAGLLVVLTVLVAGLYVSKPVVIQSPLGASSGTEHQSLENFAAGFTERGIGSGVLDLVAVTTSTPTSSLTASQVCDYGVINLAPHASGSITTGTVAFPSSQSIVERCLKNVGASHSFVMRNTGGTTSTIVVTATSTNEIQVKGLNSSSTNSLVGGLLGAGQVAWVTMIRLGASSTLVQFVQGF